MPAGLDDPELSAYREEDKSVRHVPSHALSWRWRRSIGTLRAVHMRKPRRPTLLAPLPPRLLQAWQAELTGTGVDARAHWWAMPHWVPRGKLAGGTAPSRHEMLADTVRHITGELDASIGGVEMWVQKRAASAAMHLHWDMDEERVR